MNLDLRLSSLSQGSTGPNYGIDDGRREGALVHIGTRGSFY
jgi:hypothetical protein